MSKNLRWNRPARLGTLLLCLLVLAQSGAAREVSDDYETYIVVEGDTLRGITRRLLGTELLWRDNWRLNPHIRDPDLLRIGDRLTVIAARTIEAERTAVSQVVREVDKTIQNGPWIHATVGDELGARDGIRTLADSSATLSFNDETAIRLDQYSQVFLTSRETDLRGVDRGTIEIIEGAAGLVWEPLRPQRPGTDLVLLSGDSRTELDPSAGTVALRAARDAEASRLSMYAGRGAVSAAGASVTVESGEGVAVPAGGPPGVPERLLPAPAARAPATGDYFAYDNPRLSWGPVDGAASYRAEVCADPDCEQVLYQADGLTALQVQVEPIGAGMRFWRVAGLSKTGLTGYFSAAVPFEITRAWQDRYAPGVLVALDPGTPLTESQRLAGDARLVFLTHDDGAGAVTVDYAWGDGPLRRWNEEPLAIPPGARQLRFSAADALDNRSPEHRLQLLRDGR